MNAASYVTIYTQKATEAYIKYAATTDARDADYLLRQVHRYEVLAEGARESAQRDAEAVQPVAVEAPKVQPVAKPRCPHYKAIKTFMAIARENGLDTSAKDRCRGAVGVLLGRRIETRADLEEHEWQAMGAAIKAGKLCW